MTELRAVSVEEGYGLWSASYERGPNPLFALQERTLEPLLPELRGRRVLDLACGTGRWMRKLRALGAVDLYGADLSAEMLAQAGQNGDGGKLVRASCDCLPFRSECADLILCSLALDHVADLDTFAAEMARVAAPGAVLLLSEFHPAAHARGWRRTFRCGAEVCVLPVSPRPLAEIHRVVRTHGFHLRRCLEPSFAAPERDLFCAAGKEHLFDDACHAGPALFVAEYVRRERIEIAGTRETIAIRGARIAVDADHAISADLVAAGERITSVGDSSGTADAVDLTGYLLVPGLINAHDHLEFNLFPRLGAGPHGNAQAWAREIYRPELSPVREHRQVRRDTRLGLGGLKNLLCGATTVCHHNPYEPAFDKDFPVRVLRAYEWAHSLWQDADVEQALRRADPALPFFIHLGEGTDGDAAEEIFALDRLGGLTERTVIVHGVALDDAGWQLLQHRGAAMVWCPSSNLFTLGATIPADRIVTCDRALLGSDSALTGAGDLLDEIALAHSLGVPAALLYEMVTARAASVLGLSSEVGELRSGMRCDFVALRDKGKTPAETLVSARISDVAAVVIDGQLRLLSDEVTTRWPGAALTQRVTIEGISRLVAAPVSSWLQEARRCLGPDVRLAGKRVTA